jgi:XTP/dITP diphosphohydrolase
MGLPQNYFRDMSTIIFATNNQHKVHEMRAVIGERFHIITLKEAGILIDIPEPHDTLEANAVEKANVTFKITGTSVFSEDTGLEVAALNGAPGVKSARYAGEGRNFQSNIDKLLANLNNDADRSARFRTVICLLWNGEQYLFEGICEGVITKDQQGEKGFGYDPVFIPRGSDKTFAQMSMAEKNQYSHRRKATDQLIRFLSAQ